MNDTLRAVLVYGSVLVLALGLVLPIIHILFDFNGLSSIDKDSFAQQHENIPKIKEMYYWHIQFFGVFALIIAAMIFIALKFLRKNENIFLIAGFSIISLIVSFAASLLAFGFFFS